MNNNTYDNARFDALSASNWRNKGSQDANAEMLGLGTGMLTKEHASLLAMTAGKAHATEVMGKAHEKMAADEVIMHARMQIQAFARELMMQEASLPALELQAVQKASEQTYLPNVPQNLPTQSNGVEGAMMGAVVSVTAVGRAVDGLVKAFDSFCDKHGVDARTRRIAYTLISAGVLLACALPAGVIPFISTAVAPGIENDPRVTQVAAQGVTPTATELPPITPTASPTVTVTKEPTVTATNLPPTREIKEYGDTYVTFSGKVDFSVEKNVNIEVQDGLFIRKWTPVTLDNGETVAVVTFNENPSLKSLYVLLSATGSSSVNRQLTDAEIEEIFSKTLAASGLDKGGAIETTFATGNTSEKVLTFKNPFLNILEKNLAARMITFAETGDTSVLPRYKGIPYPVVFSYGLSWPSP